MARYIKQVSAGGGATGGTTVDPTTFSKVGNASTTYCGCGNDLYDAPGTWTPILVCRNWTSQITGDICIPVNASCYEELKFVLRSSSGPCAMSWQNCYTLSSPNNYSCSLFCCCQWIGTSIAGYSPANVTIEQYYLAPFSSHCCCPYATGTASTTVRFYPGGMTDSNAAAEIFNSDPGLGWSSHSLWRMKCVVFANSKVQWSNTPTSAPDANQIQYFVARSSLGFFSPCNLNGVLAAATFGLYGIPKNTVPSSRIK